MYKDRQHAGELLAQQLESYRDKNPIVLALPRGGVPVGFEVARVLGTPLSVLVVRKLGAPMQTEFGIGAVSEEEVTVLDHKAIDSLSLTEDVLARIIESQTKELERRATLYRQGRKLPSLRGKRVILVDDGLATGVTARAAILTVNKLDPKEVVFASPVGAPRVVEELSQMAKIVCPLQPSSLVAVGEYYEDFRQTTDEEVIGLLQTAQNA